MLILDSLSPLQTESASICTVGAFDGVHLGHQQLIHAVVNDAHAHRGQPVVVTFHPHPRIVLGRAPAIYLTTPEEKAEQMSALGVSALVVYVFDQRTIQTPAAEFVDRLIDGLHLSSLWIGPDFALGNHRQGDAGYLAELGRARGFRVNVLPPVSVGPERISSTRIRASLARGDIRDVNLCLGRPFRVLARQVEPDVLEVPADHALPPAGVYPVWVCGALNEARVIDGPGAHRIRLGAQFDACEQVAVEFVE